jgi:hypothetical protein
MAAANCLLPRDLRAFIKIFSFHAGTSSPAASPQALLQAQPRGRTQDRSPGVVNSVSTWLTIMPPTIVMPRRWRNSNRRRCQHQRRRAEQGRERRHQDRPEAQQARLVDRSRGGTFDAFGVRRSRPSIAFF